MWNKHQTMWDPYTSNTTPLQTQFVSIKAAKWPHAAHLGKGQKSFVGGSFLAADINDKANNKVSSNQGAGWSQITYSPHPRLPMKKEPNCQNEDKKFPFTVENKHCFNQCTNNPTFTSWWVFMFMLQPLLTNTLTPSFPTVHVEGNSISSCA